jgi:hypothetical protein
MRMAGNLLRNLLNAIKKRRDGVAADALLPGKGRRMSLSARLILLLTIAVGVVMALSLFVVGFAQCFDSRYAALRAI